jgi:LytTr DNA-binding domain
MDQPHFYYRAGGFFQRININDIVYIKAADNYVEFHTRSSTHLVRITMEAALNALPEGRFMRIDKSYAMAWAYVDKVEKEFVTVLTDPTTELPITKKHYVECVQQLTIIEALPPSSRLYINGSETNIPSVFGIRTSWGITSDYPNPSDIAKLIKILDTGGAKYECFYIDNYEVGNILQINQSKEVYYTFGEDVDNNLFTMLDSWVEAEELCSHFLNNRFEKIKSIINHKNDELPDE